MKTVYVHLVNGQPARFRNGYIGRVDSGAVIHAVPSMAEVRRQRAASIRGGKKHGIAELPRYGLLRIQIPA